MDTAISIDLKDFYGLLAVWELGSGNRQQWSLVKITRPREAVALCDTKSKRLVFPPGVNPNQSLGRRSRAWDQQGWASHQFPAISNRLHQPGNITGAIAQVFGLVETFPGQNRKDLAQWLGIHVNTLKKYLRQLEQQGFVYYRKHPLDNRVRLYYPS
ncbi:MAG: winged helix-turn-helix transcriptional regulator [Chroococcidiopsidaceae cyanobacterium CP_BM_ER_R8_30]|nr:winged helix-turn-helix transcriptional regulator [Chroococcidiopsidaceae cyanobacterium CP_BM_ER_R8_30]